MSPEETLEGYLQATKSHDLVGTLDYVADDAIYLFSDGTQHLGKAAVQAAIEYNFQTIRNESYSLNGMRWLARSSDIAVCVFEYYWEGEIQGKRVSGGGRGTCVLRRDNDSWEIVHEHLSKGSLGIEECRDA